MIQDIVPSCIAMASIPSPQTQAHVAQGRGALSGQARESSLPGSDALLDEPFRFLEETASTPSSPPPDLWERPPEWTEAVDEIAGFNF